MPDDITTDSTLPPNGTATEAPTQAPEAQAAPPPAEKLLTQAEVNAIVAREKRAERQKVERELKATTQPQATAAQPASPPADAPVTRAELEQMKRENKFATALVEKGLKLSELQRNALFPHFDMGNPDAIVEVAHEMFPHLVTPAPAAQPQSVMAPRAPALVQAAAQAVAQAAAPYVSPGAPAGNPDVSVGSDPASWTADVIARKIADGTLTKDAREWGNSLPGGRAKGLFRDRIPRK